jgi:hypothetical protein
MSKTPTERSVQLLWIAGNCFWCAMVPLLWWHAYDAHTAAQASLNTARLGMVSGVGALWSVVGAVWLKKLREPQKT